MIGIKSLVNKDYTIQFNIKFRKRKLSNNANLNKKSNIDKMPFFKQETFH